MDHPNLQPHFSQDLRVKIEPIANQKFDDFYQVVNEILVF